MIVKEMIAEKVFAEGVAKDIRNFLPAKYENAEFQVMQMNKNNGVQMVGVQVRLQEENVCPVVYVEPFFNEIRLGEPVEKVMNEIAKCMEEAGNAPFVHNGINPMDYDSVKEHLAVMLNPETAEVDACRIEHDISAETFERLKEFVKEK